MTVNQKPEKVIRHFNRKIQTESGRFEKSLTRRQSDYGKEKRRETDEFSDLVEEKLMKSFSNEVTRTGNGCDDHEYLISDEETSVFCDWQNDTVLCWPRTLGGTTAYLPCFEEFNGIKYDSSENATRHCFENGTWSSSNYSLCLNIEGTISESMFDENITGLTSILYYIGYSVSVVALLVAMFIFLYFKDLRCLRNIIHTNLMFTYVMADFIWILTGILQNSLQQDMAMCTVLPLLLHYFHVTTFFWMFVEGLYLYMLVVETFNRTNIRTFVYVSIGWGIPLILIIIWGIVKAVAPMHEETANPEFSGVLSHCHWMNGTVHDWIFKVPVLTVMALNSIFLVMIMWVLITKLRSANNAETQQYRKATKALLVLIPLLGITYILTIVSPTEGVVAQVFYNMRAFMLSFQGFFVALFYCFLNSEVQNTVRHRMESWRTARTLGDKRYNYSRDWSPRSRTESMRLYTQPTVNPYKKRESCASEVTTTTVVNSSVDNNNGSRVSSGFSSGASIAPKL